MGMNPETYERIIETSSSELALQESVGRALKRMDKAELAAELRKTMESEVSAGNVLMLTEEETRMVASFRAFKSQSKPGAVFKWQTRPPELGDLVVIPGEQALVRDPQDVS